MSIHSLTEENIEFFTIETHPSKSYSSRLRRDSNGSVMYFTGVNGNLEEVLDNTGSVYVYANRSPVEKEATKPAGSTFSSFEDSSLEALRQSIVRDPSTNKSSSLQVYLSGVHASTASLRKEHKQEIIRFEPTVHFTSNTVRKTLITNHLMPYYRPNVTTANFNFTNYNSVNFFSASHAYASGSNMMPDTSVLLYPNPPLTLVTPGVYTSQYGHTPSGSFSFDFWINPRYTVGDGETYKAGCLLHLTGAYAISLHSGSYKDKNGRPTKFRMMLQLSSGSNVEPSKAVVNTSNIFMTDDNVLNYNTWHHVTIRHGGSSYNHGSGSFIVDGNNVGNFSFTDDSFGLYNAAESLSPNVLCVGNYYRGVNVLDDFFNTNAALRDGLIELNSNPSDPDFNDFEFSNPLRAEFHDLKLYDKYLNLNDIEALNTAAPTSLSDLKFYLPPFFTEESPNRQFVGDHGGILVTPFFERDGTTTTPYNGELAFSVNGHYMNLENYTRDFASGTYPRLWMLSGSAIEPPSSVVETANYFMYSSGSNAGANKRRLYTILPCDHGNWQPNFDLLKTMSGALAGGRYSNDLGNLDIGHVSLRTVVTGVFGTSAVSFSTSFTSESNPIVVKFLGAGPDKMLETPGDDMTIYNRLRDGDSNQVVVFDISNLFYGMRIKPGTLVITDQNISGSDGAMSITLKDDKHGNLYRGDSFSDHATWASVGNVFYNEGLVFIKAPQLFFFGREGFNISFNGVQNIHTTTYNCYARPNTLLSSSNTTWDSSLQLDEDLANEPDQSFVYITGINIHDDNMNIIMKARMAQPIPKKSGDKLLFKCKLDF